MTATALTPSISGFFLRKAQDVVLTGPLRDGVRQTVELETGRNSVWGEADLFDKGTDLGFGMGLLAVQKVALLRQAAGVPSPGLAPCPEQFPGSRPARKKTPTSLQAEAARTWGTPWL